MTQCQVNIKMKKVKASRVYRKGVGPALRLPVSLEYGMDFSNQSRLIRGWIKTNSNIYTEHFV
jgi:hypothetical protein